MKMKKELVSIALLILLVFMTASVYAQEKGDSDLAKQAQNPIANLISLPLQNNTNFGIGPDDKTQNILNVQPVWPITLNEDWNLITRTILPLVSQPGLVGIKIEGDAVIADPGGEVEDDRTFGLGDTTFTGFFSPKDSGKLTWGVGPVLLLPTATDDALGSDKWGAGASVVLLTMPGNWVVGSLFSNVWSFAGSGDNDINLFTWQYFINYNLPNKWYLTSAPIITANWEADSDNTWTVPFGGGFGKIFNIGKQPVNGQVSAYYNVETPDFGADWQLRVQLQFLFPK